MNDAVVARAHERRPLHLLVEGRVRTRRVRVTVQDVSEGGCRLKASPGFANVGEMVSLKLGKINAPMGTISWVEGGLAGVRFDGQLHPAILDVLTIG